MMSTESNHSSENSHQGSPSAEAPQRAEAENDWPGAAPPAGWFLRSPANGQPESGESPISWYEQASPTSPEPDAPARRSRDGRAGSRPRAGSGESADLLVRRHRRSQPAPEPPAARRRRLAAALPSPLSLLPPATPRPARYQRPVLAAPPVVSPTRALRGRPGGPGFQPKRPAPGARKVTAGQSPWQTSYRLWSESEIPWEQHPANDTPPHDPRSRPRRRKARRRSKPRPPQEHGRRRLGRRSSRRPARRSGRSRAGPSGRPRARPSPGPPPRRPPRPAPRPPADAARRPGLR